MKKKLLLLFALLATINYYSQISYEKGYYIDNEDQKVNCLIKNNDWRYNPTEFEYKISENDAPKNASIETIKEFGLYDVSRYIRLAVDIDRSSEKIGDLSDVKEPIFKEEVLFLRVLVSGKANLYEYLDGDLTRYFYSKDNSKIEQLIFKSYMKLNNNTGTNNTFRNQLYKDLKCASIKMRTVEILKYRKNDLIKFFGLYSKCQNEEFIDFEENNQKDLFNLTLRPRINGSSLTIDENNNSISDYKTVDFGYELGLGFGIEAEFILPFNKGKWSFIIEPTFQNFKSVKTTNNLTTVSGGTVNAIADYSSLEIPVGLRHYFFLKEDAKIFINASLVFDISSSSTIKYTRNDDSNLKTYTIDSGNNFSLGAGYKFKDTYSVEFRYQNSRELLLKDLSLDSGYTTTSIIFGYSFF
jgi:hypothetical protein